MSARVHDRTPFAVSIPAEHLPLIGELHPLRREFEKWLTAGHLVTLLAAVSMFAAWYTWQRAQMDDTAVGEKTIVTLDHFPSPPPIPRGPSRVPMHGGGAPKPDATPEPVDNPADINATLPTREEVRDWGSPGLGEGAWPDSVVIPDPAATTARDEYIWFDQLPELLRIDPPVYSEIVRDAGIDGTVTVRVLIGVNGRVKEAVVVDGTPALHAPAIESARSAVFRPALQGTRPVEVWIAIPVVFQLHGGR